MHNYFEDFFYLNNIKKLSVTQIDE